MQEQNNITNSLAYTKWNCKYHIVFAPKCRRMAIYGEFKKEIGKILPDLCERKNAEIIEAYAMPDQIHALVSIPPNVRICDFRGCLKGKSTMRIFKDTQT